MNVQYEVLRQTIESPSALTKPKLLFFQYRYGKTLPKFVLMHRQHQVKCLSEFFNVVPIQTNCDYRQICAQHEPDLALFEMLSDAEIVTAHRLEIANVSCCEDIPKLALLNADSFCAARAGFISDMERFGIDAAFSICTAATEHTPDLVDKLFVWPNSIDADLYHDYGLPKVIPVYLTGNLWSPYPWRRKVQKVLAKSYPHLLGPHQGYIGHSVRMMYGEPYARAINASWFVPTCGTVAKEVVRKHFEIPGSKACLITEKTAALEEAGFVDMQNCVFAEETDVLDKVDYLFDHPDELTRIIEAGYDLVHSRHTLRQRDQIFQWFSLHKRLAPGQRIVQNNAFGPLVCVDGSSGIHNFRLANNGMHLDLLQQGDAALWGGDYATGDGLYRRSSKYIPWMPEPKFRLALSSLYQGDAKAAYSRIAELIQYIIGDYKAADPDPVEWAYLIVSLLCLGKIKEANDRALQFSDLHHPDLDYARWAVATLQTRRRRTPQFINARDRYRCSIHQMPYRSFTEWVSQLCIILEACKRPYLSAALKEACILQEASSHRDDDGAQREARQQTRHNLGGSTKKPNCVTKKDALFLPRRRKIYWLLSGIWRRLAYCVHRLEAKYGYFLPYCISERQNDEFYWEVRELARANLIETALIIGGARGQGTTESFLAGIMENENASTVFWLNGLTNGFVNLDKASANNSIVRSYAIPTRSADAFNGELEATIRGIKEEHGLDRFDVVLIDGSKLRRQLTASVILQRELRSAKHVLLDNLDATYNHENYHQLAKDPSFMLVACNPGLRNGYAIFKRVLG
jgi:hypothetical protein